MTAPSGTTDSAVHPVEAADPARPGLIKRVIAWGTAIWERISGWSFVAHLLRGLERFNARLGIQFAGAITYFSLLSLVPILMVGFSIAGFILADRPDLLAELKQQITDFIPGTDLANQIGALIDQAISARVTVGIIGLVIALYSGIGWMGNVRKALRAIWWPVWRGSEDIKDNLFLTYLKNLGVLAGLGLAVALSFVVTTIGSTAQGAVVGWLGLDDSNVWIWPLLRLVTLAIATFANLLIFTWCYARLPPKEYRAPWRPLLIGSAVAALVFEVLKSLLTLLIRGVSSSATAAVFGSTIGLMFFFNIVAQVFLIVGAWIATDVHTPGGTAPSDDEVAAAQEAAGLGGVAGREPVGIGATDGVESAAAGPADDAAIDGAAPDNADRVPAEHEAPLVAALGVGLITGWLVGRRSGRGDRRRDS